MICFFSQLTKEQEPFAGGKGRTLARLYRAGYRVPNGFIIMPQAFTGDELTRESWVQIQAYLTCLRRNNKDASFAVRSSAWSEDSIQASFAGEFETILDVQTDDDIREAINTVRHSRHNTRVKVYSQVQGLDDKEHEIAIIIQYLIRADISGVLFTIDPVTGSLMKMTGNLIHGIGEKLVSGNINPDTFTFDRPRGLYNGPQELKPTAPALYRDAYRLERMLGAPQDIEWAVAKGRLYILQSRPITTLCGTKADTYEWNDSLTGNFLWSNTNLSEQAPEVRTPFSCSLIHIHESDGLYSKVFRGMRIGGYPLTGVIGGRAYSNLSVMLTGYRPLFGGDTRKAVKMLGATFGDIPPDIDIPIIPLSAWSWWTKVLPGLIGYVKAMNRLKRQIPQFVAENPLRCAKMRQHILETGNTEALAALWQDEIKPYFQLSKLLVFASAIDISPRLEKRLRGLVSAEDVNMLLSNLSGLSGRLESLGPVIGISKVASGDMSREDYMEAYGHRGVNEFECAWPRPLEDPAWLDRQIAEFKKSPVNVEALFAKQQAAYEAAWERFVIRYPREAKGMKKRLEQAAQVAQQREKIRSEAMRSMAIIRAFALRAGELTGIGEDIFFLTIDEVCDVLAGNTKAIPLIPMRKSTYERYRALPQYPSIIVGRFDPFKWASDRRRRSYIYNANASSIPEREHMVSVIKGFAGALGNVEGIVRCLERLEDSDQFQTGEILVTSITNIGWTPLFPRAAAIITDIGAPLSHAAIVARELGIPAVVGCGNATMHLKTGDLVYVDGGRGRVEIIRSVKGDMMVYPEVVKIADAQLLPVTSELYGLEDYQTKLIKPHTGGRNVVYTCEKEGADAKILRIAFLKDRSREDFLGEVEYIRYLFEHGGSVSNVVSSRNGNLLEEITHNHHPFFVCLFEKARGKMLVENNYRYREGVPITEYYYNCGKVLGKLHQLSKEYIPVHRRYRFFDKKYNPEYIDKLIPGSLSLLKAKLVELLKTLAGLDRDRESFGMIHFDYNDGNYMIDFDSGQITVYDFDNSCFGWYMFDLASVWGNGVGWVQFEPDAGKRKKLMEDYFETVLAGYRSETRIEDSMLATLPLFIQANLMEGIVERFEDMRDNGEESECDEELSYRIKCLEDDIPYEGFFHEIYSCKEPFEYEKRNL